MQENTKSVVVKMTARRCFRTEPIWQYDVGHVLTFEGFELPASFEVHFSRSPMGNAIPQIGTDGTCTVPDMYTQSAGVIYAWLYIVDTDTGLTKYSIEIPVAKRAKPTNQEPTPVEQSAIDQAIAALNAGVERSETAADAAESAQEAAEGYAESAGNSAITAGNAATAATSAQTAAETAARNAAASATDANASRQAADQSATNAGVSERAAASSATAAAGSATSAAASAGQASASATAASGSASTASTKASEAAQSATAAAGSAASASEDAGTASTAATAAEASATAAAGSATAAAGSATSASQSATAAAGSAQTAQDVLDSIPADYSELSGDVDSLKSAFDELNETVVGTHLHEQLYDKTTNTSGGCLRADGTVRANTNYEYTDYIPLETGYTYVYTGLAVAHNFAYACFYDSSKTLLPNYSVCFYGNPATGTYTLNVPDDASYVRFSIYVGGTSTSHDDFVFYKTFDQNGAVDDVNGIKTQLATLDTLKGKTALFFGDSICNGSSAQDNKSGYAGRIGTANAMNWHNYGYNGATVATISGHHSILADVIASAQIYTDPNFIILEGGTNDADNLGAEGIGTYTETDYSGAYDTATFSGAFETMLYNAVQQWPHAQIGYVSAHKMGNGNNRAMRRSYFLRAQELCKKWGVPFIDLWIETKLNRDLSAQYDPNMTASENISANHLYTDGQHLTPDGYNLITPQIEWWMRGI